MLPGGSVGMSHSNLAIGDDNKAAVPARHRFGFKNTRASFNQSPSARVGKADHHHAVMSGRSELVRVGEVESLRGEKAAGALRLFPNARVVVAPKPFPGERCRYRDRGQSVD